MAIFPANPRSTQELVKLHELVVRPIHDARGVLDAVLNANDGYDDKCLREVREKLSVALGRLASYIQDPPR